MLLTARKLFVHSFYHYMANVNKGTYGIQIINQVFFMPMEDQAPHVSFILYFYCFENINPNFAPKKFDICF
jgi:hypothetical protein